MIMMFAIHGLIVQVNLDFNYLFSSFSSFLLFYIGSEVGVQRDCISTETTEYQIIRLILGRKDSGCVKRPNGFDCFTFCSLDKCN